MRTMILIMIFMEFIKQKKAGSRMMIIHLVIGQVDVQSVTQISSCGHIWLIWNFYCLMRMDITYGKMEITPYKITIKE